LCASRLRDSLTQWVGYAGQQGYAIGLDTSTHLVPLVADSQAVPSSNDLIQSGIPALVATEWFEVIYRREDQVLAINRLLDFCVERNLLADDGVTSQLHASTFFGRLLAQLKHPAFEDEREVRLISGSLREVPELYRASRFGIVPYTKLGTPRDGELVASKNCGQLLPIVEVLVGPAGAKEQVLMKSAVERMLRAKEYSDVRVSGSDVPFRF